MVLLAMTSKMAPSSPPPPLDRDTPTTALPAVRAEAPEQPSSPTPPVPSFAENDPLPAFDLTPLPQPSDLRRSGSVPPPPPRRNAGPAGASTPPGAMEAAASPARTIPAPGIAAPPAAEAGPSGTQRALSYLRSWRAKLASSSNAVGDRLPGVFHAKVAGVPATTLIGSVLFLAAVVAVGVRYGLRQAPDSARTEAQAPPSEPHEETAAAATSTATPQQTSTSATPSPSDETAILLAQAERLLADKRDAEVAPLLDRALARKPELKGDPRVAKVLRRTAASDDRLAASDSFAMLTGPMGEAGAKVLYEISLDEKVRKGVRQRADNWLQSKEFDRTAPLALYAAVKLRSAKSCEAKQGLLEFAAEAGDEQALTYLRELEKKTVCSPDDLVNCYPCLRSDSRLETAIAKLSKRVGG